MTQEDVHFIDKSAESEVGSPVGSAVFVPTLSEPGLLVMDVDSTLIDEEVIDELGEGLFPVGRDPPLDEPPSLLRLVLLPSLARLRLRLSSMSQIASQNSLTTAWSLGNRPRSRLTLRSR